MTFREVYDEHFRFVWRQLRRLGVPASDVADAVQEVFLVVHRRLDDFEGRSKMSTWIFGICMRVTSDRRRSAYVRRTSLGDAPLVDCADEQADVGAEAERREGLVLLEGLLGELPLEQRAVFALFELEGMRGEDIAEALEIPLGTVWSRLRLAREAFQRGVRRMRAGRGASRAAGGEP